MKKVTLIVAFFISIASFAQKDELKTLKRLYDITSAPSDKDKIKYNEAIAALDVMSNLDETQKNEYNFYKGVQSILDVLSVALNKPTNPQAVSNIISFDKISLAYSNFEKVKEFEKNEDEKSFTNEINSKISPFLKEIIKNKATFNYTNKNYQESSKLFYLLYIINKEDIMNLENASQVAIEAKNYEEALKYYKELKNNPFLTSGKLYYAFNKISEKEDQFSTLEERNYAVSLPNYEKPRDESASLKKPQIYKYTAILLQQNNFFDEAKKVFAEAKTLNPNDKDLMENEIRLYFNTKEYDVYFKLILEYLKKYPDDALMNFNAGEYFLFDDVKIVEQINANLSNDAKYNELSKKRKEMYEKALPYFEKAYRIDPKNENNINFLRATYNILDMPEKAAKF